MTHNTVYIRLEGSCFQPAMFIRKTKLPFKILAEPGKVMKIGRFKGKPSPYGLAQLEVASSSVPSNLGGLLKSYTNILLHHMGSFQESGVEAIIFDVEVTAGRAFQTTLTTDVFNNLSKLNASLQFHALSSDSKGLDQLNLIKTKRSLSKNRGAAGGRIDTTTTPTSTATRNKRVVAAKKHPTGLKAAATNATTGRGTKKQRKRA